MSAPNLARVASNHPVRPAVADAALLRIGRAATAALYDELALDPKPGLVSFVDAGSHHDMDARTFMRSLFSLRHYFPSIAALGAQAASFPLLEQAGLAAETRMLNATQGVNTHRGAIFSLGLLCASAGWLLANEKPLSPGAIQERLLSQWGDALVQRCGHGSISNGQSAARLFGLRSAGEEASLGFPVLFNTAVPVLRASLRQGLDVRSARIEALFHIIAHLDDTNLAHRGGLAGLRYAQQAARDFLGAGGAARADGMAHARSIHQAFVVRRLSPGGAADILAAACWVMKVCKGFP
jgi:triphosphoribosyl-dephospho-CoA synthase